MTLAHLTISAAFLALWIALAWLIVREVRRPIITFSKGYFDDETV